MGNNGHMELEHPSVWLIKQEVSRRPSDVVREAKTGPERPFMILDFRHPQGNI